MLIMDDQLKDRITKIYELVKRGGTEGEKAAAETALNKLLKKHNLTDEFIKTMHLKKYEFKYATSLDLALFKQLFHYFFEGKQFTALKSTLGRKSIFISFEYLDYVLFSSAYEYFKRHMNSEFKKICVPLIKKCKSTKTKNARRAKLQDSFFGQYIIKSKIYHQNQVGKLDLSTLSEKERADLEKLEQIQGGQYNTQVTTGLYLE
jgi:hypothetical protein